MPRSEYVEKSADSHIELWRAVIWRAMQDTVTNVNEGRYYVRLRDRDDARAWLLGDSAGFREVCDMAGLHPDTVRSAAKGMVANPTKRARNKRRKASH